MLFAVLSGAGVAGCRQAAEPEIAPAPIDPVQAADQVSASPLVDPVPESPPVELVSVLSALEQRYPTERLETTFEALPVLEPYFELDGVTSGTLALREHWDGLDAGERSAFAACLAQVFEDVDLIEELTAGLPNGYHDVAFALPESRVVYEPVLEQYGLDPATATSYSVASSLSTWHDRGLKVSVAAMLCDSGAAARGDFLQRFTRLAREKAGAATGP